MKSGNYHELIDKLYAGTASTEEISLLQSEGLINQQDVLYADALKMERDQKIDWEFEDFIHEIPSAKLVAFPVPRIWWKRSIAAAAMVAIISITYIFWPQQTGKIANVPSVQKSVDNSDKLMVSAELLRGDGKNPVTESESEKAESLQSNKIVVKQGKAKLSKEKIRHADEKVEGKIYVEDFQVIVNGTPITNEEEAIAITRKSLAIVSQNITTTMDAISPLREIKINL